jgi:GAF domain-containing protein
MISPVHSQDVPHKLLEGGQDLFEFDVTRSDVLNPRQKKSNFIEREKICSCSAIRLRLGDEVAGALFINFRQPHVFSEDERRLIQSFSAVAAVAMLSPIPREEDVRLWMGSVPEASLQRSTLAAQSNLSVA